jgi:hypothetical protein
MPRVPVIESGSKDYGVFMAYENDRECDPKVYTSRLSCCKAVSHDTIQYIYDMT